MDAVRSRDWPRARSTWNGTLGMLMRRGGGARRVAGVAQAPSALSVGISWTRHHGELAAPVLMPGTSRGPGGRSVVTGVSCSRAQPASPACARLRGERHRLTSSSTWRSFRVEHGAHHLRRRSSSVRVLTWVSASRGARELRARGFDERSSTLVGQFHVEQEGGSAGRRGDRSGLLMHGATVVPR